MKTRSRSALSSTASESSSSSGDEDITNNNHDKSVDQYFTDAHIKRVNSIASEENEKLNLNLGLPVDLTNYTRRHISPTSIVQKVLRPPIQTFIRIFDWLLSFIEGPLFIFWSEHVPLWLRQKITFFAWSVYLPIHKLLIGRRSGLHRDVSYEYHALTTAMWAGRLFPITVKRMRMSLSQLHAMHPPDRYPQWSLAKTHALDNKPTNGEKYGIRGHLYEVYYQMKEKRTPTGVTSTPTTKASDEEMVVTGSYVQHSTKPSKKVIFWIYGGAFLGGDSKGNLGIAEKMGMLCADKEKKEDMRDVFIPDYRLIPEYHLDNAIHDMVLSYEYLVYERGVQPKDITLVGVSSGGGLVVLIMQALAKARKEYEDRNEEVPMPSGGVMMGPFIDFTEPKGTMKEHIKHDLVVNQSVYDEGIPFLEKVLGSHENRVKASPVYGDFKGLPPLCIVVSEHEVVYDQAMVLAKRAKDQGVDVTVGVWKYMCHVFPLFCGLIPEGRESFDFMLKFVKEH